MKRNYNIPQKYSILFKQWNIDLIEYRVKCSISRLKNSQFNSNDFVDNERNLVYYVMKLYDTTYLQQFYTEPAIPYNDETWDTKVLEALDNSFKELIEYLEYRFPKYKFSVLSDYNLDIENWYLYVQKKR